MKDRMKWEKERKKPCPKERRKEFNKVSTFMTVHHGQDFFFILLDDRSTCRSRSRSRPTFSSLELDLDTS